MVLHIDRQNSILKTQAKVKKDYEKFLKILKDYDKAKSKSVLKLNCLSLSCLNLFYYSRVV